jgi:lysozyme
VRPVVKGAGWVVVGALAIALVVPFEGFAPKPYYDAVGVKTICYGQTAADGANFSKVYTKAECEQMLVTDLQKYDGMIHSCIKVTLPPHREAALVSFTYNLGQGALCHGAVARDLNAGNVLGACNAILLYNHAGGHVLVGLTKRRQVERTLCLRND